MAHGDVVLRGPQHSDKEARAAARRDQEWIRGVGGDSSRAGTIFTPAEVDAWYARLHRGVQWVIELKGACVGHAGLVEVDERNRRAAYAIGIFDPAARGQGVGTIATRLVLAYAFEVLGLHRVELRVLDYNHRAIRCYEKCGFIREGIDREGALIDGEFRNDIRMGILDAEYEARPPGVPNALGPPR